MNLQPSNVFSEALAKEKDQRGLPRLSEGGPPSSNDRNVGVLGSRIESPTQLFLPEKGPHILNPLLTLIPGLSHPCRHIWVHERAKDVFN